MIGQEESINLYIFFDLLPLYKAIRRLAVFVAAIEKEKRANQHMNLNMYVFPSLIMDWMS